MKNIKQKYYGVIKYFNTLIKKILVKYHNKTNNYFHNKFKIININTVKNYNYLIKKNIVKFYNKTDSYFHNRFKIINIDKVSTFNKCLISLIALSFMYIFYLLIPTIYDRTWIQNNIESKLLNEFKINFSVSSKISYEILPSPHFTLENVKIIDDKAGLPKEIAEIKKLKVFISQLYFFDQKKLKINKILINNANFIVAADRIDFYKNFFNNKFSDKKIFIKESNIFYRSYDNKIISIVKVNKLFLHHDELNFSNKFNIKAKVFKVPFDLKLEKKFLTNLNITTTEIDVKKLKLSILNESSKKFDGNQYNINGSNLISTLNEKLITNYSIKDNLILFESDGKKLKNKNFKYKGKINFNPFDLNLDIDLNKFKLNKLINSNSLLVELFKTKILLNENISAKIKVDINKNLNNKLFNSSKIILNVNNGKINFDRSMLFSNQIGSLKVADSVLFSDNNNLMLNCNLIVDVKNYNKFYSFFQTPRNSRKPIEKIYINLDYNFFDDSMILNSFKIDSREPSLNNSEIISNFNSDEYNVFKNFIKNKIYINKLLTNYDG